jgi:hypothetical protein
MNILAAIATVLIIVWAYRIEMNTAKTKESLERIEHLLAEKKKGENR